MNPAEIYNQKELEKNKKVNFNRPYQQCSFSVLDTIADPNITFDENGVCHYYQQYKSQEKAHVHNGVEGQERLKQLIDEVKKQGKGKKYDCIAGVSGGVDSSYLVYQAIKWGLRPLIVHFDNGWNSELAVQNIQNLLDKLGVELYTYVVNWNEFRDIQKSYFKASVVDIEVPTDHAISGTLLRLAYENDVKFMLSGNNVVTEAILPSHWIFNKNDHVNLKAIHKNYGTVQLKTFPIYSTWEKIYYQRRKKIKTIKPLNLVEFNKDEAKKLLINKLGWRDYGGKHYESIFTKFYQAYVLPKKFNIDKRKAHLSNLIFSGQITKQEALKELEQPLYEERELMVEKDYVLKKLGFTNQEFEEIMQKERVEHTIFPVERALSKKYPIIGLMKKLLPIK